MIIEILNDIKVFIVILFASMVAYGQITAFLQENYGDSDEPSILRTSYVLAFGELGSFDNFSEI